MIRYSSPPPEPFMPPQDRGGRDPYQRPARLPVTSPRPADPVGPLPGPASANGPDGGGNLVGYPEWFEPGDTASEPADGRDHQEPGPIPTQVSQWPGWDALSWNPAWPMGTLPSGGDPATGQGGRGADVRERSDYAAQQAMFAGGGPMFAGPDANPGGADLGGDGMPPAGFRIFGTM